MEPLSTVKRLLLWRDVIRNLPSAWPAAVASSVSLVFCVGNRHCERGRERIGVVLRVVARAGGLRGAQNLWLPSGVYGAYSEPHAVAKGAYEGK